MAPYISEDVAALIGFVSEAILYGAVIHANLSVESSSRGRPSRYQCRHVFYIYEYHLVTATAGANTHCNRLLELAALPLLHHTF